MRVAVLVAALLSLLAGSSQALTPHGPCCYLPPDVKPCTLAQGRALVESFVRAFNAGNTRRLNLIFAREPAFQWYSTGNPGQRFGAEAENRATLMRYFAARHRQRERLRLVTFVGGAAPRGDFGFGFHLERRAIGYGPRVLQGKGSLFCSAHGNRIIVWSNGAAVQ